MHFVVWCIDRPGAADVRQAARPAHRDWLDKSIDAIAEAAPCLAAHDEKGFTNKLALLLTPPRPKPSEKNTDKNTGKDKDTD